MRFTRFLLAAAIALGLAGSSAALTPDQRIVLFGKSKVHDGITLDFRPGGKFCVKAPSQPANCAAFTALFTFTGDNKSYYRAQTGLLVASVTNVPRIEYDASGNVLGLLIEGSRTNRALWSNDVTNAAWVKVTMTTAQTATGPDGVTNSATTLTATGANSTVLQAFVEAATDSDYCAWIKRRTGTGNIDMTEDTGATWTTMAVTSTWTKFCAAHQSFLNPNIGIRVVTNGDAVDVWGNQLEAGAFGTSTIPTTTVAVTRADDTPSRIVGNEFNTNVGTLFAEFDSVSVAVTSGNRFVVQADDGTSNERALMYLQTGGVATMYMDDGGVNQTNTSMGTITAAANKGAYAYALNDLAASLNAAAIVTDATATMPTMTRINLGKSFDNSNFLFGHIRRLDYWPVRQPNDFLQFKTLPGSMSMLTPANDNRHYAYG